MLKFFRRIRFSLLNEGNSRKYLVYAIGEIALVVIGILIALQINIWNEERKSTIATDEALANVLSELQQDSLQFQFHIKNSERISHSLDRTIAILFEVGPLDSLEYYFQRSKGYLVAVVHNSAFQSLNQQGLVSNISNDTLRIELLEYFNFVQPSVVEFREFEYNRFLSSINQINTDIAIDLKRTTVDDLQLDYKIVFDILREKTNLKKLYFYRDTQVFLRQQARNYVHINKELMNRLKTYLDR